MRAGERQWRCHGRVSRGYPSAEYGGRMMADSNRLRCVLRDITVVVPTNGRDLLQGCLESIANSTAWPAHLIVVHQGSSPRVAAWVDRLATAGLHAECVASD